MLPDSDTSDHLDVKSAWARYGCALLPDSPTSDTRGRWPTAGNRGRWPQTQTAASFLRIGCGASELAVG